MEAPTPFPRGPVNPFESQKPRKDIKIFINFNKDIYILNITNKNECISFILDQEENLSSKYYQTTLTIKDLQLLGKSFRACDTEDEVFGEFRYIIEQKEKSQENYDISIEPRENNEMLINIKSKLNNGTKENLSIVLSEEAKDFKKLNEYLLEYINKLKKKSGIKTLTEDNKNNNYHKDHKKINLDMNSIQKTFCKSRIISNINEISFVIDYIKSEEKKKFDFKMIFQSFKDGDSKNIFHQLCDNKSPTLTIIKTKENVIFGGFTTISLNGEGKRKDDKAFCFNVTNKKIYEIIPGENALESCSSDTLFNFGKNNVSYGCTIFVGDKFLGDYYFTSTKRVSQYKGMEIDYEINNGKSTYYIAELEIYQII